MLRSGSRSRRLQNAWRSPLRSGESWPRYASSSGHTRSPNGACPKVVIAREVSWYSARLASRSSGSSSSQRSSVGCWESCTPGNGEEEDRASSEDPESPDGDSDACGRQQAGVSTRGRPGCGREVPSSEQREGDHKRSRPGGQHPLASSRTTEAQERRDQQAVPALEHDRGKRYGDRRQRVCWRRSPGPSLTGRLPSSYAAWPSVTRVYVGAADPTSSAQPEPAFSEHVQCHSRRNPMRLPGVWPGVRSGGG